MYGAGMCSYTLCGVTPALREEIYETGCGLWRMSHHHRTDVSLFLKQSNKTVDLSGPGRDLSRPEGQLQ